MDEKYQEEIFRLLTYISIPASIIFITGYLIGSDVGGLLQSLGVLIPFTFSILAHVSLKYNGQYFLAIGALGGLSFGLIIWYIGSSVLNLAWIEVNHYILLAVILMCISAALCAKNKFTEMDQLINVGMSMMGVYFLGTMLGLILALVFGSIFGRIGGIFGLTCGIIIMLFYYGGKLSEHHNIDEKEIYDKKGVGIIGAGIGGVLGLGVGKFYLNFYSPLSFNLSTIEVPLSSIILLMAAAMTGFFSAYLTQIIKERIDKIEC